jgi:hypothetical protein
MKIIEIPAAIVPRKAFVLEAYRIRQLPAAL